MFPSQFLFELFQVDAVQGWSSLGLVQVSGEGRRVRRGGLVPPPPPDQLNLHRYRIEALFLVFVPNYIRAGE